MRVRAPQERALNKRVKPLGILAYGSLIDDPGPELAPLIMERRDAITPFRVEFARRSSKTRGGAPTLVPVRKGGAQVRAKILILHEGVSQARAEQLLWRRETDNMKGTAAYRSNARFTRNRVRVASCRRLAGVDTVLYVRISPNIRNRSARALARLAMVSATNSSVERDRNGIAYLLAAKRNGISTPLMADYEAEILRLSECTRLEDALEGGSRR